MRHGPRVIITRITESYITRICGLRDITRIIVVDT